MLDFIYLTTIDEQVLISFVCADVSARVSVVWKKAWIPFWWQKNHVYKRAAAIPYFNHGDRTQVAAIEASAL